MHTHNLRELIEYDDKKFFPKVLSNQPGYRLVLLNMRSGQSIPPHATKEMVTVFVLRGHITFYEGDAPVDLRDGELLYIEGSVPHRLESHEDSSLLVLAAGNPLSPSGEELDLREVPRHQRHPLVFTKFDELAVGECFDLINDHDPVPLNRQIETMRPKQAEWRYITRGPDIFRIRIRRVAPLNGSETSAEIYPQVGLHEIRGA